MQIDNVYLTLSSTVAMCLFVSCFREYSSLIFLSLSDKFEKDDSLQGATNLALCFANILYHCLSLLVRF